MTQLEKARQFAGLHVKGRPLVLYNIWDAGSARAVLEAGASAIATGSWSVAAAHGFDDGEAISLDLVEMVVGRIATTADAPLSVDFERGYGSGPAEVARNVRRIVMAGAVGINFEDGLAEGQGLVGISDQCERIGAIRDVAAKLGMPLFINARTDLFLREPDRSKQVNLIGEAKARAAAYADAGADGFFVPGLVEEGSIERLCRASSLPVNVMILPGAPPLPRLAELGVARVSFGPLPFVSAMQALKEQAEAVYAEAAFPGQ